MRHPFVLALAVAALLVSDLVRADDHCDVEYQLAPRYDSRPRRLDVTLSFAAEGRRESWLRLSNGWAGIKDFDAALTPEAEQAPGVSWLPDAPSRRWKIQHGPEGRVTVRYQIRAALNDPDDGKAQAGDQLYRAQVGTNWFQFFGYGALASVDAWDDKRHGRMCLTLVQPPADAGPLLGSYFDGRVQAQADVQLQGSHALLRHAFYAGGPGWRVVERRLSGGAVVIASRGQQGLDDARFADQAGAIMETHRRFWGDVSSPRQTVVRTPNHSPRDNGGTLVHHAAVLHVSQDFGPNSASFESLIGHENLHQWLPQRLGGRDPGSAEQMARHYWLSEGFTTYYTNRLLLASGHWTLARYAEQLTRTLRNYWRSPARNATADSIAPRFFSDYDAGRQMYMRGEFLAMGWDRDLRATRPAGLDGLLRGLLLPADQANQAESARERVLQALTDALGPTPRARLQAHVVEGRSFELDEGLAGPCFMLGWTDTPRWVLGFYPGSLSSGTYKAQGVVTDGPAYRAGLREGMEFKGWTVIGADTTQAVVLKIKTGDGDQELRYLPVDGSTDRLPTLAVRPDAGEERACQAWQRR